MKLLALATALCFATAAQAVTPTKAPAKAPVEPPPKMETRVVEPVNYEALTDKVGREIVVITTLGTRRRGTLQKVSQFALIVKLDAKSGGIELDIPRNTVRSVELVSEPMPAQVGDDSAKKK
jgi:hypothetical protein